MQRSIVIAVLGKRKDSALRFQRILTRWGCSVKTRLGIHDGVGSACADAGLIILEIVAEAAKTKKLVFELGRLPGTKVKLVSLGVAA